MSTSAPQSGSSTERPALATAISDLRRELAALDAGDPAARSRIESLLSALEADGPHAPGVHDSLSDSLREFEVQHPRLTSALERVLLALSSMGI